MVALESTIVSHGLPRPDNLRVAREIEQTVRGAGAVPATIGMVGGELIVGLDDAQLTRLATADDVAKLSVRDLAVAAATGADGATTVAATSAVAAAAGIEVFATGGLGGVHRDAADFDESADLVTLARTPIAVVCAGREVDPRRRRHAGTAGDARRRGRRLRHPPLPRLLPHRQRLRPRLVAGLPGAGRRRAAPPAPRRACTPARWSWPTRCRSTSSSTRRCTTASSPTGMAMLERDGITGKAVTPFLLGALPRRAPAGASLAVNVRIILRNADLAAQIAVRRARPRIAAGRCEHGRRRRRRGHRRAGGARRAARRRHRTPRRRSASPAAARRRTRPPGWPGTGVPVTLVARRRRRRGRARPGSPSCARPAWTARCRRAPAPPPAR